MLDFKLEEEDRISVFLFFGSLSNRIGEELLGEALTVVTQLMLLFDLREKYNQCD